MHLDHLTEFNIPQRMVHGSKSASINISITPLINSWAQLASLNGYEGVHNRALTMWEEVYPDALLVALTDTFTTQAFFKVR
jgi:hypothetical protein